MGGTAWGEEKKSYIWFTREGSEEPSFSSTAQNKEDVAQILPVWQDVGVELTPP